MDETQTLIEIIKTKNYEVDKTVWKRVFIDRPLWIIEMEALTLEPDYMFINELNKYIKNHSSRS